MKNNAKYTAWELLREASPEIKESVFGKKAIIIAGIVGITKPDHLIKIQRVTTEIIVMVGNDHWKVRFQPNKKEFEVSKDAHVALEARGKIIAKKTAEIRKTKKEAKLHIAKK